MAGLLRAGMLMAVVRVFGNVVKWCGGGRLEVVKVAALVCFGWETLFCLLVGCCV